MIEEIYKPEVYPKGTPFEIEKLGATAISVANRWMLGWEAKVRVMLENGNYLHHLKEQTELEKTILSEEPNSTHLARWEILKMNGVREDPPI